ARRRFAATNASSRIGGSPSASSRRRTRAAPAASRRASRSVSSCTSWPRIPVTTARTSATPIGRPAPTGSDSFSIRPASPARPRGVGPARVGGAGGGGGGDLGAAPGGEPYHPGGGGTGLGDGRKAEACPRAETSAEELPSLVRRACHEDERAAAAEGGKRVQHARLALLPEAVDVPEDEELRPPEERRRCQLGERRGELVPILIAPQRTDRTGGGNEPATEHTEGALHEISLFAEEQVVRAERTALECLDRIRRRPLAAAASGQKPSI